MADQTAKLIPLFVDPTLIQRIAQLREQTNAMLRGPSAG